ncbi:NADH-quinone oxidoreductase subunit C [Desulfobacterota bacterium M19]
MNLAELEKEITRRWPAGVKIHGSSDTRFLVFESAVGLLREICGWLFTEVSLPFGGTIAEEGAEEWELRHVFYGVKGGGWVQVTAHQPLALKTFPSISTTVHAASWQEREIEDLFGLTFEGHPLLGDFVLHNDIWQEGVEPMRHCFNARTPVVRRRPDPDWRPRRIVHAPGSFIMPIGPVFAGANESVHLELETVGEDVIRAFPRLFYKYRGVEKIAEGRSVQDVLLLAERFSATTAFAHALAFCQAAENICAVEVPVRAAVLRVFIAELERFRHHVGVISAICESTALAVAASQTAILEEELLRLSAVLSGHRYLFGLAAPGGMARDLDNAACGDTFRKCQEVLSRLEGLEEMLRFSSSFLDRLEEVGIISRDEARNHSLVGPMARASGVVHDLRKIQPYSGYQRFTFEIPREREGDGYARLRVLFEESRQSVQLMEQAAAVLEPGPVAVSMPLQTGAASGWVEAPRGAAFHWLRLGEDGRVARYRINPPSFINWHGFHLCVENFAFQDLPIILATLDLSVAENDR